MKIKLTFILLSVIVIATLTYFNYERVENAIYNLSNKSNVEEENIDLKNFKIIDQRYYSLLASLRFSGSMFPSTTLYNISNDQRSSISLKGKNIVVLLSNAGCNPCQIRELKNIDSLYQKVQNKTNIIIIYDGVNKDEPLYLKKLSQIKLKFYYTSGSVYSNFNFTKRYPAIFFLKDNLILSTLIAIPNDEAFSSFFYNTVINNIML